MLGELTNRSQIGTCTILATTPLHFFRRRFNFKILRALGHLSLTWVFDSTFTVADVWSEGNACTGDITDILDYSLGPGFITTYHACGSQIIKAYAIIPMLRQVGIDDKSFGGSLHFSFALPYTPAIFPVPHMLQQQKQRGGRARSGPICEEPNKTICCHLVIVAKQTTSTEESI